MPNKYEETSPQLYADTMNAKTAWETSIAANGKDHPTSVANSRAFYDALRKLFESVGMSGRV